MVAVHQNCCSEVLKITDVLYSTLSLTLTLSLTHTHTHTHLHSHTHTHTHTHTLTLTLSLSLSLTHTHKHSLLHFRSVASLFPFSLSLYIFAEYDSQITSSFFALENEAGGDHWRVKVCNFFACPSNKFVRPYKRCKKVSLDVCYLSLKPRCYHIPFMFLISLPDVRQPEFATHLGPLKNCCPKFSHKFVCPKWPQTVQPAQPIGQSCQKTNFKQTFGMRFVRIYIGFHRRV